MIPSKRNRPRCCPASVAGALLLGALLFSPPCPVVAADHQVTGTTLLANREFAQSLIQGIRNARKSILCCYYLFKTGDSRGNLPSRIANELIAARRRGVEVTVILETNNNRKDRLAADNHATAAILSRGGVKVFFDSPGVTTHTKVTVVDERYVYLGSHNLTQSALLHNNELSVLLDSPEMAAELKSYLGRL